MARIAHRLSTNVPGDFFVDAGCIDCGACQRLAPATFDDREGQARVFRQPEDPEGIERALMARIACPVSAIGTVGRHDLRSAARRFPERIDGPVFDCGYASPKSFGATSYLIERPGGNVLVDSPRFARSLVSRLEERGGVALLFLTHRDDVADHERFHRHFGCERILHAEDAGSCHVERRIAGTKPVALDDEIRIIPVPGHTPGSACLLFRERYLFPGDHLSMAFGAPGEQKLRASRRTCWYSWTEQIRSMERLAEEPFEWVLPGHGERGWLPRERMREEMGRLLRTMRSE